MTTTANSYITETTHNLADTLDGQGDTNALQAQEAYHVAANEAAHRGKPESELRAAARRHGYTLKELADRMGVNYSHLCSVANGRRPWTPELREKVMSILGEVPGQGIVYRQGGIVNGESTCIRERARERGLTQKDLAEQVGVSEGYMSDVCRGRRNMSPALQTRVERVLGGPVEIAPALCANRKESIASGGSSYIRERARELGLSLGELADLVGVSRSYMTQASRGHRNLSPEVQARVEAVLDAPVKVEAAQPPAVDPRALWDRMDAHGWSQNEVARRAGISVSYLSQIMNGQRTPSGDVLRRLHGVLFAPTAQELVAPVELKVMAWKKGGKSGVVVQGAGGPGADTIRTGGRVPWGAEVEFAYTSGYDSRGRLSVNHIMDERGYGALLSKPDSGGNDSRSA